MLEELYNLTASHLPPRPPVIYCSLPPGLARALEPFILVELLIFDLKKASSFMQKLLPNLDDSVYGM